VAFVEPDGAPVVRDDVQVHHLAPMFVMRSRYDLREQGRKGGSCEYCESSRGSGSWGKAVRKKLKAVTLDEHVAPVPAACLLFQAACATPKYRRERTRQGHTSLRGLTGRQLPQVE